MNKDMIIKIAAEAAVKATLETLDLERKRQMKSRMDKRLRNTKLLLKNYNTLKSHCDNSVGRFKQIVEEDIGSAITILDSLETASTEVYIESIRKSVSRTYIILKHIDTMLELYDIYCSRSMVPEDARRNRILRRYYIDGDAIESIIESEGIEQRTFYRDIRSACDRLSALIFGIDGLTSMTQSCHLHAKTADVK